MTKHTVRRAIGLFSALAITLTVSGWVPFTAPVTLHSTPEGAEVFKAGGEEAIGTTPFETFVFITDRELEVRLDRFHSETVVLDYNSPEDVYVNLRPQPVLVYTVPDAEIYSADSGELVGETPMDIPVDMDEARSYVIRKKDYFNENVTIGMETANPQIFELKHRPLITLSADQSNVAVYENGTRLGTAPLTEEVSNPRTFEFRKEGFYPETLKLTPAQTHKLSYAASVKLTPLPVVEIVAKPADAKIYMAGESKALGTGSAKVKIAEKTTFTVKADRYYDETFTVEAKSQKADVTLKAMPYVTITSSPSGARVSVDGESVGTTPVEQLIEEPVSVKVTKEGYLPKTVTLDGSDTRALITLEKEKIEKESTPTITISTTPAGASVSIDGQAAGTAPVKQVVKKPVTVVVSMEGYLSQTNTYDGSEPAPMVTLTKAPEESSAMNLPLLAGIAVAALALIGIIIGFIKKKK